MTPKSSASSTRNGRTGPSLNDRGIGGQAPAATLVPNGREPCGIIWSVKSSWARGACSDSALCGISKALLGALITELTGPWTAARDSALAQRRGHGRLRAAGAGPDHQLVFVDRVLVTLVVLRWALSRRMLAALFGVSPSTIDRAVGEVRPLLAALGFAVPDRPGIRLRTLADVFAYAQAEGITLRIDGTEVQVRRPKAGRPGRKAFVSGGAAHALSTGGSGPPDSTGPCLTGKTGRGPGLQGMAYGMFADTMDERVRSGVHPEAGERHLRNKPSRCRSADRRRYPPGPAPRRAAGRSAPARCDRGPRSRSSARRPRYGPAVRRSVCARSPASRSAAGRTTPGSARAPRWSRCTRPSPPRSPFPQHRFVRHQRLVPAEPLGVPVRRPISPRPVAAAKESHQACRRPEFLFRAVQRGPSSGVRGLPMSSCGACPKADLRWSQDGRREAGGGRRTGGGPAGSRLPRLARSGNGAGAAARRQGTV